VLLYTYCQTLKRERVVQHCARGKKKKKCSRNPHLAEGMGEVERMSEI
jgi:hypothetical protein